MGERFSFTIYMKKYYKDQCKNLEWVDETNSEYDLMLGDDSDSLITANLNTEITNGLWDINYFYDFKSFYRINKRDKVQQKQIIGVDMAFTKNVRCFDNHIQKQFNNSPVNPYCMNLNNFTPNLSASKNYYKKYPFSTLMMVMSYYDIPLPKSQIGKEIVLAIDSSFKGAYATKDFFKKIHTNWLEELGFESLIDILNSRSIDYFYKLQDTYNLNEKVYLDKDGYLKTNINLNAIQPHLDWKLELPNKQFHLIKQHHKEAHLLDNKQIPKREELISLAFTGKNYVSYTYKRG